MIFVAVGTQKFQFDRLIEAIDKYAEKNQEDIFGQIGASSYCPWNFEYQKFLDKEKFDLMLSNCDILITHGGVATIMEAVKLKKKIIVVPRLQMFGEHIDNHQLQIAESFDSCGYVYLCNEVNKIEDSKSIVKNKSFKEYVSSKEKMLQTIEDFLDNL